MHVLVVNAFSTLNRGDAAILDGLIATLRTHGHHRVTVATKKLNGEGARCRALGADATVAMLVDPLTAPRWVRSTYPVLALWVIWSMAKAVLIALAAPRSSKAMRAYHDADAIISTGGSYLGGGRPGANVLTVFPIWIVRLFGKQPLIAPITVKPMSKSVARLLAFGLRGSQIFARDLPTIRRLRVLGITATFASDLAFRSESLARHKRLRRSPSGSPVVAWAPRQFGSDHDAYRGRERIVAQSIRGISALVMDRHASVLLVPQSNVLGLEDDTAQIERIARQFPHDILKRVETLEPAATIEDAARQFGRADVLLAFRMHAAIIALFAGTPALVVGYESKVSGVFETLGLRDWVIDPEAMPAGPELARRLLALTTNKERARIQPALERAGRGFGPFDEALRVLLGRDEGRHRLKETSAPSRGAA